MDERWSSILSQMEEDKVSDADKIKVATNYFNREIMPSGLADEPPDIQAKVKANFFNTVNRNQNAYSFLPPEALTQEDVNTSTPESGQLTKGLKSGFYGANKAVGDILDYTGTLYEKGATVYSPPEAMTQGETEPYRTPAVPGAQTLKDVGETTSKYWGKFVEGNKPRVQNFTDIDWSKPSDFTDWAAWNIGQMTSQVGVTAPFMVGGGPVAGVGGFTALKGLLTKGNIKQYGTFLKEWARPKAMEIPIGILEGGQVAEGQLERLKKGEVAELDPIRGLAGAFIATKLESLGAENAVNRLLRGGIGGRGGNFLTRIAKNAIATGAGEGTEEFFQTYAEQFGIDPSVMANRDTFMQAVNGAAAGMIGGMAIGGGVGAVSKKEAVPIEPQATQAPPAEQTPEAAGVAEVTPEQPEAPAPTPKVGRALNTLSPEFFTDISNAITKGQDKDGNDFSLEDAQGLLDTYKTSPNPDPGSVAAFTNMVNTFTASREAKKREGYQALTGFKTALTENQFPDDASMLDERQRILDRHPFLADQLNRAVVEHQGSKLKLDEEPLIEPQTPAPPPPVGFGVSQRPSPLAGAGEVVTGQAPVEEPTPEPAPEAKGKELWEMTAVEATSEKVKDVFPIEGKVEVVNGKPIYKFSTTIKWGNGEKTFEIKTKALLNGAQQAERLHKVIVQQALSEGKPVPRTIIEEYGDLAARYLMPTKGKEGNASITESRLNSYASNTEFFSDFSKSDPFTKKGFGGFDVPTQRLVLSRMVSSAKDSKVRDVIIQSVPVDVVDKLIGTQRSPNVILHDLTVDSRPIFTATDGSISLRVDIADTLVRSMARDRAKEGIRPFQPVRSALNNEPAVSTFDADRSALKDSTALIGTEKQSGFVLPDEGWLSKYGISADMAGKIGFGIDIWHDTPPNKILDRISQVTGKSKSEVLKDYPELAGKKEPTPETHIYKEGEKPLRQIVGEFVDMRTAEHNASIDSLKAAGKISEIPFVNKQVSALLKMDRMRHYNDAALNGPDGLAKLPKWLQQEFAQYRYEIEKKPEPVKNEEAKPAPDLSAKSTQELVGDIFNIINDHIGERGSVSEKPKLDDSLYEKLKPYLMEIVKRAKAKALDVKAYLLGAVDSMPEGKAKDIYELAANRYVGEEKPKYVLDKNSDNYKRASVLYKKWLDAISLGGRADIQKSNLNKFLESLPIEEHAAIRDSLVKGETKETVETAKEEVTPAVQIADKVTKYLQSKALGNVSLSWNQLFEWADEAYGGTQAQGKYTPKDAYDAMELGVNKAIEKSFTIINPENPKRESYILLDPTMNEKGANDAIDAIKSKILNRLPTQTKRTEEMDKYQQFSTPPSLAYVANWVANIQERETYLEPSAGIGGIAVFGKNAGANVVVNELSPRRAAILKELGFDKVYQENAEQINNILPKEIQPSVIVMNPPFSETAGRLNTKSSLIGFRHVEQALKRLLTNGRLVAILGSGATTDNRQFRTWWDGIKKDYTLRANIGVSGKEYQKYGTTYGNQILVIDKVGGSEKAPISGQVDKVEDLIDLLKGVRNERIYPSQQGAPEPKSQGVSATTSPEPRPKLPVRPAIGELVSGGEGGGRGVSGEEHARPNVPMEPATGVRLPGEGERGPIKPTGEKSEAGRPSVADTGQDRGQVSDKHRVRQDKEGLEVQTKELERQEGELTDSVYDTYKPQKISVKDAKAHPGALVESSAMAVVEPPDPTYSPKLPKDIIKTGKLSEAQLESIIYAGQAHSDMLPNGKRRGYFIGDGTGVGKGREIAGILLDNWNQGRHKAVWISQNSPLINDAKRDTKGIGWNPDLIYDLSKTKIGDEVKQKEGIMFVGYRLLSSKKANSDISRLRQIANWLGKDFDGVIVFDECHNMGNAIAMRGRRGMKQPSEQALAGVLLQEELPNARIVYVSATGATEVTNLSYADRIGLWGEGTPFANKSHFIEQISSGGIAAMELVARDMKAMGSYMSRSLSYHDVKYEKLEHTLTPEQRQIYNELAEGWQIVLANINDALAATQGDKSGSGKSAALAAFWSAHQRFFNQIITSMQTPAVVNSIENDLKNGHAAIIQIVNTNESEQRRALARMEEEDQLEDLDLTPRDHLMEYIKNSFPVSEYEAITDENGNIKYVPVKDSNGNPVENAEAVAMREALLERLGSIRVPDGPLEILINHFGIDKVAEITGRTRRVVKVTDETGTHRIVERRSKAKSMVDADAFMNDKKPILIFSYAGGTGRSYHADMTARNQRLRRHYLLQAGWRADRAIQGFGRSHRSNQKQAPEMILVTTDITGQKRFISSIARRLDQLGALTKGQRETGSGGFFTARDNLESEYAHDAVSRMIQDIYRGNVPNITMSDFMAETGLHNLINQETGGLDMTRIPPPTQFLNRLLNMSLERQEEVFAEFSRRLDQNIQSALEAGTLDVGMETLRAEHIRKLSDQVVHTDKKSGAKTKHVQLEVERKAHWLPFDLSDNYGAGGYAKNVKSGQVWVASAVNLETDANTGEVKQVHTLRGPRFTTHKVSAADLNNPEKYERISKTQARPLWEKEFSELPKTLKYHEHMLTGTILPIWDRIAGRNDRTRIMRVQTDEGERMIGRLIAERDVADTLRNLGVTAQNIQLTPREIFQQVKELGYHVTLANGWTITRRRVSGENRIELRGPDYKHTEELKKRGVFVERISYDTRYFIPTTEEGIETIKKITENRPVVEARVPSEVREDTASIRNIIDNESGAFPLSPDSEIYQTLLSLKNNAEKALPHLEAIGSRVYRAGNDKILSWYAGMKKALGDLWNSFKSVMGKVWAKVKEQRGSITIEPKEEKPVSEAVDDITRDKDKYDPKAKMPEGTATKDTTAEQLNEWIKDGTDAVVQTFISKLPSNIHHMSAFEMWVKSPEWYSHPVFNRISRLFTRDRNELYHEYFNHLISLHEPGMEDNTVIDIAKKLKHKGLTRMQILKGESSKEYKDLQWVIDYGDTDYVRNLKKSLPNQLKEFEDEIRKKGISEEVIKVWKYYRQSYDMALDLMTEQMRQMIDQIQEEAAFRGIEPADYSELYNSLKGALVTMKQWKGFYAPRLRQGSWAVTAYRGENEDREYYREHRWSQISARRLAKRLEHEGWKIKSISEIERLPEDIYQDIKTVDVAKAIESAIENMSKGKMGEGYMGSAIRFNEELLQEAADMIRARGFRSSMIHRKPGANVTRGYVEDPMERHIIYTNNLARGFSKAKVAQAAYNELMGTYIKGRKTEDGGYIKGRRFGGIDPKVEPRAYTAAKDYIEEQLRNLDKTDRIIGLAKSIATFKFLGFNARSALVNTTAMVTTVPPSIHQYVMGGKGSMMKVHRELIKSGKDYAKVMATGKTGTNDEGRFLAEQHRLGWDDPQYTRDAMSNMLKIHNKAWAYSMEGAMYIFGKTEQWNRGTTMLAAYRLARKNGKTHEEASELAKNASDKAHGVYGRATLPAVAWGRNPAAKLAQMLYVYGKFSHNYLQMLYDLGIKKRNIKAALYGLLSNAVIGGAKSFAFAEAVAFPILGLILVALGEKDRDEDTDKWVWDRVRNYLGDLAERTGRYGLFGAMGLDISGSLSIGLQIPKNWYEWGGAIGGVVKEIGGGIHKAIIGDYAKATEHLLPTGVAAPIRAYREHKRGVTTEIGKRVYDETGKPYMPTTGETAMRVLGVTSSKLSATKERLYEAKKQVANFQEKRNEIYERYRTYLQNSPEERDMADHRAIREDVQKFNQHIKDLNLKGEVAPISFSSMRKQAKEMRTANRKTRRMLQ